MSLLFDNDGTVVFAMVMAVWGEFCVSVTAAVPITFSADSHPKLLKPI